MYCILNAGSVGPLGERGMKLTSEIIHHHYRRESDFVWEQMADDVMWIGPLRMQFTNGLSKLVELLQGEQEVTCSMEKEAYQVVHEDNESCLIVGSYFITTDAETGLFIRCLQRVTFYYHLFDTRLKVVHMHLSQPYEVLEQGEVFPFRFGKEAYDYMTQTHQMAFVDSLTGLGNRNAYETSLMNADANLGGMSSLCFILFDLNGLKEVNDNLGHLAGDGLLREFAALLRKAMPKTAELYRYGGDEFIASLKNTSREDVDSSLKNLERHCRRRNETAQIALSFARGLAFLQHGRDRTIADVIRRADAMLYAHKKAMKGIST